MKLIVAGSRDFTNYFLLKDRLDELCSCIKEPIEIVSGRCPVGELTFVTNDNIKVYGADGLGEKYAKENGYSVKPFPPDRKQGKKGFYLRNKQMANYATHCICFFGTGENKGTKMMARLAKENKLPTAEISITRIKFFKA